MPEGRDINAKPVSLDTLLKLADKPENAVPLGGEQAAAQEARLALQLHAHEDHNRKQTVLGGAFDGLYGGEKESGANLTKIATEMQQARLQGDTEQYKASAAKVDQAIRADNDALWTNDLVTGVGTGAVKAGGLFMAIAATKGKAMFGAGAATFALFGLDQAKTNDTLGNQATDFALGGTKGIVTAASFKALSHGEINPMARGVAFGTSGRLIDLGLSRETYQNPDTKSGFDFSTGVERTLSGTFASRSMVADALLFGVSSKLAGGVSRFVGPEMASSQVFKTVSTSSMFGMSSGLYAEFTNQQQTGEFNLGRLATRGLLQATADGLAGIPAGKYSAALAARTAESTSIVPPAAKLPAEAKIVPERSATPLEVVPGKTEVVAGKPEIVSGKAEQPVADGPAQRQLQKSSDVTLADGTRIIEKPNGTKVTVFKNGDRVLEEPGAPKITFKTDGRVIREMADGKVVEHRSKFNTPLDERPLNIASGAYESIGKALSNFARRPFVLDGKQYESVEGFYQGLKWSDPIKRAEVAQLSGPEAKSAGRGSKATSFEYEGKTIDFRSPEHYALMKRAIKASLEQNPAILEEFQATSPRPMEHKTGRRENPKSGYPSAEFIKTLLEVRSETLAAKGDGAITAGKMTDNTNNGVVPVSDLLKTIKGPEAQANHDLKLYVDAFKDSGMQASSVVATGRDAVVLKLADGNILKITTRTTTRAEEPFDMPILSSGYKSVDGRQVKYTIQPEAQPATRSHLGEFLQTLTRHGYRMTDPGISQIGLHDGLVKLLDPYAVTKN